MNHFHYRDGELHCEEVPLQRIADEVGTPVYVYSTATIERHYRVFDDALAGLDHLICYSVKANSNLSVLRLLFGLGAGADIVSGGELTRVLRAGGDPKKVVFSGVGKTEEEMRAALEAGVLAFNVESEPELRLLDQVASAMGVRAPISLRVNPDVDPQTHPYISTGLKNNKFGIAASQAGEVYAAARGLRHIDIVGVDCHIGSQLTKTSPFSDAVKRLVALIEALYRDGIAPRYLDIGGGLGIPYGKEEEPEPPTPAEYGAAVKEALAPLRDRRMTILCEPGRVIVGNAGALVTRVLYDKLSDPKRFLVVDAAMNDLIRPSFYGSFHPMRPVVDRPERARATVDVVGPICESGDFLARDRELPVLERGELLCVGAAGAYSFTMSSNYNTRPRAAEVLVRGASYQVVRRRETVDQLLANEEPLA
ncbi:MAG TPA: diaminopimelate decarboxylase [Kofleriaceae bacterium]|nr:diaminopimelate decarboxylase [Kofleriaceae bacterium]